MFKCLRITGPVYTVPDIPPNERPLADSIHSLISLGCQELELGKGAGGFDRLCYSFERMSPARYYRSLGTRRVCPCPSTG